MLRFFNICKQGLIISLITFILFEAVLRIFATLPEKAGGLQKDIEVGIIGIPHLQYGEIRTNADGFNDREHSDETFRKIIFVGDSFTFGVTSYKENFPYLVENLLGGRSTFPVSNFGVPGTGPREYLPMVEKKVLQLKPELVVLTIFVGNDIDQSQPNFRTLIFLNELKFLPEPSYFGTSLNEYYTFLMGKKILKAFSRSEKITQEQITACSTNAEIAARLDPRLYQIYKLESDIYKKTAEEQMQKKYFGLESIIRRIFKSTQEANAKLMIVLAPSEFQVNPNLRSTVLACLGKNISDYDTEIPQRFIKNILEMENIPYVDLLPTFSKQDSRITYQNLDTHWNATGNKMAAEAIYSKIKEMRLQGHTNVN